MEWMKYMDSKIPLHHLSIPGTHDSIALRGGCWLKTQDKTLEHQLKMGVRFFDIRLKYKNGHFSGYHQFVHQGISLVDILTTFSDYLDAHPSEAILMCYRDEGASTSPTFRRIEHVFHAMVKCLIRTTLPTLHASRGRIVIIDRRGVGVGLSYSTFFKRCNLWGEDNIPFKLSRVQKHLDRIPHHPKTFYITSLNGSNFNLWDPFCLHQKNPREHATVTNAAMVRFLQGKRKKTLGVILMDFPPPKLIHLILQFNFGRVGC